MLSIWLNFAVTEVNWYRRLRLCLVAFLLPVERTNIRQTKVRVWFDVLVFGKSLVFTSPEVHPNTPTWKLQLYTKICAFLMILRSKRAFLLLHA